MTTLLLTAALAVPPLASALSADYGPGGIGSGTATPIYDTPIRIIDTMWINPDHRQQWYLGRNDAFTQWGLPFAIEQRTAAYGWNDENVNGGLAIQDIVPNAIVIVRNRSTACSNQGGWDASLGGGIVVLCPWAPWWRDSGQAIAQTLAHELGHALGFGHGGSGIMAGGLRPNATDRALAKDYYAWPDEAEEAS